MIQTALTIVLFAVLAVVILLVTAQFTGYTVQRSHVFKEDNGSTPVYHYAVKLGHWLPRLTPWHEYAITIGATIYVTGGRMWPALEAHEFRHVVRWKHDGPLAAFYFIRSAVTFGYWKSNLEAEAVTYANAHSGEFEEFNPFNETGAPRA